jgi:hypothetical protein
MRSSVMHRHDGSFSADRVCVDNGGVPTLFVRTVTKCLHRRHGPTRPSFLVVARCSVVTAMARTSTGTSQSRAQKSPSIGLSCDVSNGVVHVHKMAGQSLGTVTPTACGAVAQTKRSSSQRGRRPLAQSCDRYMVGRRARVRADRCEHAAPTAPPTADLFPGRATRSGGTRIIRGGVTPWSPSTRTASMSLRCRWTCC